MSGAPYGAGKINNKMKIAVAAGSRGFFVGFGFFFFKGKKKKEGGEINLKMRKEE